MRLYEKAQRGVQQIFVMHDKKRRGALPRFDIDQAGEELLGAGGRVLP
jgi:hypothetical protein